MPGEGEGDGAMSFFENARRPEGLGGKLMVNVMNVGHRPLAAWGMEMLPLPPAGAVLDCGCGGGANIRALLERCPGSTVRGVDLSPVSVEKARRVNAEAIGSGRCEILQAGADRLPFADGSFALVTAFETVYFWPGLEACFREIGRVLRPGGYFFICNECGGDSPQGAAWAKAVEGMKVYSNAQLRETLSAAGFRTEGEKTNRKGWVALLAQKEG